MLNTLSEIFKNSLKYPYCSATAYYSFDNIFVPEKFWADCYMQTIRLKKQLLLEWINCEYIDDIIIGRHRSTIFYYWNEIFYMSPYLLHPDPILIKPEVQNIVTYPFSWKNTLKINFSKKNSILEVSKYWTFLNKINSFVFNLNQSSTTEISKAEYLARIMHPEQTTLSIRVVDFEDNNNVLHYIFDFTRNKFFTISKAKIFIENSVEFNDVLKRIAEIIYSSPDEIVDYIYWAYKIRNRLLKNV